MDSDSSHECDEHHNGSKRRDWDNRQNSDVSDDENFSRGAKSIDSPPESPPRGGGNLDSPPASPAQGVESPHSVYSGSRRSSVSSSEGSGDYPQSPEAQTQSPRSPLDSPDHEDSRSREIHRDNSSDREEDSRDKTASPVARGRSVTPEVNWRTRCTESSSPSPRRSAHTEDQYGSPKSCDSRRMRKRSLEPESPKERHPLSREVSLSPQERLSHSRSKTSSPEHLENKERSLSPARWTPDNEQETRSPIRQHERHENRERSSSPARWTPDIEQETRSPIRQEESRSNSPYNRRNSCMAERVCDIGSPDSSSSRNHHTMGRELSRSPNDLHSPIKIFSPKRRHRYDSSSPNSGSPSPTRRKRTSPRNIHSPDRCSEEVARRRARSHDTDIKSTGQRGSPVHSQNRSNVLKNDRLMSSRRDSPDKHSDSDGRSNISSNSSIGSPLSPHSRGSEPKHNRKPVKIDIKSHGEDLSDVSDVESIGSASDEEPNPKETKKNEKEKEDKEKKNGMNIDEAEQLDFEAEETDSPSKKASAKEKEKETIELDAEKKDEEEGEAEEEGEVKELEEGELSDEGEVRPEETEPRPVCRFFSRGQCTWGSSCSFRHPESTGNPALLPLPRLRFPRPFLTVRGRGIPFPIRLFNPRFVHPGVTDKGNYTMFDMVRPLVPMNAGPPPPHMYPPPMDCYRPPMDRPPMMGPPPYQQPMMRRGPPPVGEEPPGESAWERGLRQAKEMLRRSSKRKETDADFEEKKMTLGIQGQDEYDKENDYYPRPSSPIYDGYHDRPKDGEKRYRSVSDRFGDYPPPSGFYREDYYDERGSHYHRSSRHHSSSGYGGRGAPDDYYESNRKKKYSSREVVVQRGEKGYKETSPPSTRSRGGRGDEWADPWMRSKSPTRKGTSRRKSYSSRSRSSSYSSSSSSSRSSYSSYSRSRSRSSLSRSSSRSRSSFSRKKLSPLAKRAKSPFSRERRVGGEADRVLHMNPPPPSPRGLSPRRNPTPPSAADRANRNIRLLAAAMRDRSSVSSRSSSGSESSGSTSDSSSDSGTSSSSSSPVRHKSSLQNRKKIELSEKLVSKAMDAFKLKGQKQNIRLNLNPGSSISERLNAPLSRKRPAPDSPNSGDDSSPNVSKKKGAPSRREELLKQLKAVEDAIARKRSKI